MAQPYGGLDFGSRFMFSVLMNATKPSSASRIVSRTVDVPSLLKNVNPYAYLPRTITIGLIYQGSKNEEIRNMNMYKEIYMSRLLERTVPGCTDLHDSPDLKETVHMCSNAMLELASNANMCYPEASQLDEEATATVMLLDGCFILELLMRWSTRSKDSLFQTRSVLNNLVHDLLLVENQIPFFILEKLFNLTLRRIPQDENSDSPSSLSLKQLIFNFFCNQNNSHFKSVKIQSGPFAGPGGVKTLLSFVHSHYQPQISEPGDYMITRYSATEIFRSGIKFKPSKNEKVYLDVRFKTHCLFFGFLSIITAIFLFPWRLANFTYKKIFYSSPHYSPRELPLFMPIREEYRMKSARASCCWLSFMCQLCGRATLEIPELSVTDSTVFL